ncbi:uncharacterized protein LOC124788866 [Schistocerca piceifrons]|uniref:uncharacterized protein LOC124788866 n=1 Tax=Schistocerca piceifrons TaxID=274613 RepID=UPI001F5FD13E|nr:uncharacterized protein LOC124788866 [Schistocerca piceifrons]
MWSSSSVTSATGVKFAANASTRTLAFASGLLAKSFPTSAGAGKAASSTAVGAAGEGSYDGCGAGAASPASGRGLSEGRPASPERSPRSCDLGLRGWRASRSRMQRIPALTCSGVTGPNGQAVAVWRRESPMKPSSSGFLGDAVVILRRTLLFFQLARPELACGKEVSSTAAAGRFREACSTSAGSSGVASMDVGEGVAASVATTAGATAGEAAVVATATGNCLSRPTGTKDPESRQYLHPVRIGSHRQALHADATLLGSQHGDGGGKFLL